MKYCKPNLPHGKVKQILVSSILSDEILQELVLLGIEPIKLGKAPRIISELAYHPDILTLNYAPGKWLVENNCSYSPANVNIMLTEVKYHLGNKYPADCIFNSFVIGKNLYCGVVNSGLYENVNELNTFTEIQFKQGYAKCSIIVLNDHSFITSDKSIEKKLLELQYDCLLVSNECIKLNGYNNGFIGGCAGKISEDLLAFTGNIKAHVNYNNIKDFCKNHNIEIVSLSNELFYDYGGLLPISEY
ncbi:MAG: hypothetical protein A2Y15_03070 [Clostridiales bacterium GWF2_36_10]|nr:MAG: hypothetical protein A2Y15_03070 [Clostridiales bacterium GWF2_36_10]HAN20954.1 hypothetical protein [Clostridiales bacterium]